MELTLEGDLVDELTIELPPAKPLLLKALGETLPFTPTACGRWASSRKVESADARAVPACTGQADSAGAHKIKGTLRFQACSDTVCEPPEEIPLRAAADDRERRVACTQAGLVDERKADHRVGPSVGLR